MTKSSRSFPAWAKSVIVLFAICLVIGILLPALNDILYVSPEERTLRAVRKIYGTEMQATTVIDVDNDKESQITYDFGSINKVFKVNDDILVQATGFEGYKNGTITLWVRVVNDGENKIIDKVLQESFTKQTLMSKLDGKFYNGFLTDVTKAYKDKTLFTSDTKEPNSIKNPVSGATYSANAACNAVNAVIKYVNEDYRG